MTDSTGDEGRGDAPPRSDAPATEPRPLPRPLPPHPVTELSPGPAHPATELDPARRSDEVGWEPTSTAPARTGCKPGWEPTSTVPGELRRRGPGVPSPAAAERAAPTAEEVWRTGLPSARPPGRASGRWRRRAGSALTVALLIAVGVVIYLRLHHG